jgi:Pectate lyase superfamily protein
MHGAKCDGVTGDTSAFKQTIAAAPKNGTVEVPIGNCVVSDTLVVVPSHAVSIVGSGRGSQIFMKADKTLLDFQAVQSGADSKGVVDVTIRDLFLGSAATTAGTALIRLVNSENVRVDNVDMLGAYYGLHLNGAQSSKIIDLRSGVNFSFLYFAAASVSQNQYWVYGDRGNGIATNRSVFIAPSLEGGVNGLWLDDMNNEGGVHIHGGTIEGVQGTALSLNHSRVASRVIGLHFEANQVADIVLSNVSHVELAAILSDRQISILGDSEHVSLIDSQAENVTIDLGNGGFPVDTGAKYVRLQNISACFVSGNTGMGIVPTPVSDPDFGMPNGPSSPVINNRTDIVYDNIGYICGGG